jgi:hypothetical protein
LNSLINLHDMDTTGRTEVTEINLGLSFMLLTEFYKRLICQCTLCSLWLIAYLRMLLFRSSTVSSADFVSFGK